METIKIIRLLIQLASLIGLLSLSTLTIAEENGTGHYLPGSIDSFIDGVPSQATFVMRLNFVHYDGSFKVKRTVPVLGTVEYEAKTKASGIGVTFLWSPDWLMGDKWSYATSATIPVVTIDTQANLRSRVSTTSQQDEETNVGDIILMPLMFNYAHSTHLNSNYRLAIYAPTGSYKADRLNNTGKNFWTFTPTASVIYLSKESGIEASIFIGADFNTKNNDTEYKSGIQAHIDGTLAQHFKLFSGVAGAGISGFWYQQLTADSGDGALFGDFKAKAYGIGPVISYVRKVGEKTIVAELKWLHDFDTENRFQSNTVFFRIVSKF
jgi:hypothetical protein